MKILTTVVALLTCLSLIAEAKPKPKPKPTPTPVPASETLAHVPAVHSKDLPDPDKFCDAAKGEVAFSVVYRTVKGVRIATIWCIETKGPRLKDDGGPVNFRRVYSAVVLPDDPKGTTDL